jgi:putative ATP-binding cassette transporter
MCGMLVITQVNEALTMEAAQRARAVWVFAGTVVVAVLGGLLSSVLLERMSLRVMAELRLYISERILKADFRKLECLGGARVQAALSEHCSNVAGFFTTFPSVLTNVGIVSACLIYMFMLSSQVFAVALAIVGLGAAGYHFAHLRAIAHIRKSSEEHDAMFSHFRSLTDGAKELRLHGGKRAVFLNDVLARSSATFPTGARWSRAMPW